MEPLVMWWIAGGALVLFVLRELFHRVSATFRAKPSGQPTPEEARIDKHADDEKQKVQNASDQDLADEFFDRMRK